MPNVSEQFNRDVRSAIDSGVRPIEFRFFPIVDFEDGVEIAYRTEIEIRSLLIGDMNEKFYERTVEDKNCGVTFFRHATERAIRVIKTLKRGGKDVKFVSIKCPASLVEKIDFYETLKEILKKNTGFDKSKLCIEFSSSVLDKNEEKTRIAIADVKALGVKTAIRGCGEKDFTVTKLAEVSPDIAYIDKTLTEWADDRNKPRFFVSFVAFVKNVVSEVIIEGEDKYRKLTRNTDCDGFLSTTAKPKSLDEIIKERE